MSSVKTERLLNLVICLLSTRRPLSKAQIRTSVPQYADHVSGEAFERMFERDKEELRELGIPLVTAPMAGSFDDELGYRVDRDAYALPQVSFEPDELAVLGLAARVWQQASLAEPATRALTKLTALGAPPDDGSMVGIEPRIRTVEPAFDSLWSAVRDRLPVAFDYRKPHDPVARERLVEPWAVTSWRGRWYLTGRDRNRAARRVFRLSRVHGPVRAIGAPGSFEVPPEPVDASGLAEMFASVFAAEQEQPRRTATVRLKAGAGQALRPRATVVDAASVPGWEVLQLPFSELDRLATELVTLGPSAVVLAPDDLRANVIERLRGVLAAERARAATGPGEVEHGGRVVTEWRAGDHSATQRRDGAHGDGAGAA
ncbi:MAG: helix-turn-helix transcriptional regulator [Angustibacter sp.]